MTQTTVSIIVAKCAFVSLCNRSFVFSIGFPFVELRMSCQREVKANCSVDNLQQEIGIKLAINIFPASVTACC